MTDSPWRDPDACCGGYCVHKCRRFYQDLHPDEYREPEERP